MSNTLPASRRSARLLAAAPLLLLASCAESTGPGDSTPPVVVITAPVAGTLDLTGAVSLTATATDSAGIQVVNFFIDGALVGQDFTAPFAATLPTTAAFASGAHTFSVLARDINGNWSLPALSLVTFGGTNALPAGFTRVQYGATLGAQATAIATAADGRVFVTEKTGAVRVIKNGTLLTTPFTTLTVLLGSERGLLGIALSPDFAVTGYLYVYYTTSEGGAHNRISRFLALGDVAAAAEEKLVDLPALSAAENHNGGAMAFGPDGRLYVAVGDNANGSLAPLLTSTFGKVLRFNADGTIPGDNPFFAAASGGNRAIWARGLRNPYTLAFDPGTTRLHINDVGQGTWEEVNVGRAGADYGWPSTEGPTSAAGVDAPLFAYAHTASPTLFEGAAIVGAAFYRPATVNFGAEYVGDFFFADYVAGWIYRLDAFTGYQPAAFADLGGSPTNLAVGPDGSLYVTIGSRVDRIYR